MNIVVVGAGAAGLATGIFSARLHPGLSIRLLDGAAKIGAKILVSGGGRCNVTNVTVGPENFFGGSRNTIRKILRSFGEKRTVDFFREIGVNLHEEEHGKLFPDSNSAREVLAALLREAARRNVEIRPGARVASVTRRSGDFVVQTDSEQFVANKVVLATGGMSLPKTGSDGFGYTIARTLGHRIIDPLPALAPLMLSGDFHTALSGVSHEAELVAHIANEKPVRILGSFLWTHLGASGPAAMDISRVWERANRDGLNIRIGMSFVPGKSYKELDDFMQCAPGSQSLSQMIGGWVPSRVGAAILRTIGIDPSLQLGQTSRDARRKVVCALVDWPLPVVATRGFGFAEATAGGVALDEIDPTTMESRICPGLHFVGEILDVDGRIGGFNFQWAWSTAMVAAQAIATSASSPDRVDAGPHESERMPHPEIG